MVHALRRLAPLLAVASAAQGAAENGAAAVRADEQRRVEVFARAARTVVCIFADPSRTSGGSGVIIDERGLGLTNFHVIASFVETRRGYGGLSDGRLYPLRLLGIDPGGDVALFRLEGRERFEAAPLGDSDALRVGQWVAAMGNPFLLADDFTPTITMGVVSGLGRYQPASSGNLLEYADCIQVSSSINPGNSGGPLFDLEGRLVGVNGRASFEERGRVNVGLGYAIPINQIQRFLPALRSGRLCEHGALGATTRDVGGRLLIAAIQDFSPADQAGLRLGDELGAIGGRAVKNPNDFNNVTVSLPADWPVTISYERDGERGETRARLERLPVRQPDGAPFLYLPDREQNAIEAQAILARWRARLDAPLADAERVVWSARVRSLRAESAAPFVLTMTTPLRPQAAATPDGQDGAAREWAMLTAPLLSQDEAVGWELLGGGEVAGRVVSVCQARLAGGAVRWSFDAASGIPVCAETIREETVVATWTSEPGAPLAELPLPRAWRRRAAEDELEVVFESVELALPAGAPDAAGEGDPK